MARARWWILFGVLGGAAAAASRPGDPEGLVARGRSVFQDHCTPCHPGSRALRVAKGGRGWTGTVDRMSDRYRRAFGQEILADDREALVSYLLAEAGPEQGP